MEENDLKACGNRMGKIVNVFLTVFFAGGLLCGCATQTAWKGGVPKAGPTIRKEEIPGTASAETVKLIEQLYGDASEAANAAFALGKTKTPEGIPFLVSLLGDTRLVERRDDFLLEHHRPVYPVGYVAARALGLYGQLSIIPIIDWLADNHEYFYLRGNAAAALSFAIHDDRNASDLIRELKGKDRALTTIHTLESCTNMSTNPMHLPGIARHPDYSLSTGNRGGVFTYLRIVDMMGDARALPVLQKIINDPEFSELEKTDAKKARSGIAAKK